MNRMDGKVVLITGGGDGIGRASCELLAKAGAVVVVSDLNIDSAEETVKSIVSSGYEAVAIQHDVSSEDDWQRVMGFILEQFGKLDVLVNNAGISTQLRECKETSLDVWHKVLGVNLDGTFLGVRSAIKAMIKNTETSSIVNVSSIAALSGHSAFSYSASKGGVRSLTRTAAIECARQQYNIRVNAIYPGEVDTSGNRVMIEKILQGMQGEHQVEEEDMKASVDKLIEESGAAIPLGRLAQPIEIAKGVLFLASDDSSFMTGSDLVIDGGVCATYNFTPSC